MTGVKKLALTLIFILVLTFRTTDNRANEIKSISKLEISQILGAWYELARIPHRFQKKCISNQRIEYSELKNGEIEILNSCDTLEGVRKVDEARAKIINPPENTRFRVTYVKLFRWMYLFAGDYWVLDYSPEVGVIVIGESSRNHAWILSRKPNIENDLLFRANDILNIMGYDTCRVVLTVQDEGIDRESPLCDMFL